jgi:hypothetical protein
MKKIGVWALGITCFIVFGSLALLFMLLFWLFSSAKKILNLSILTIVMAGVSREEKRTLYLLKKIRSRLLGLEYNENDPLSNDDGSESMFMDYLLSKLKDKFNATFARFEKRSKELKIAPWRVKKVLQLAEW